MLQLSNRFMLQQEYASASRIEHRIHMPGNEWQACLACLLCHKTGVGHWEWLVLDVNLCDDGVLRLLPMSL